MHIETELKLKIASEDAPKLAQHPFVQQHLEQKPEQFLLVTTYFDTPLQTLRKHRLALRVREKNGQYSQIIKSGGHRIGHLRQRQEWEEIIQTPAPNLALFAPDIRKRIKKIVGEQPLIPLFTTVFTRTSWILKVAENRVELVFDEGDVKAGHLTEKICEVEIELLSGEISVLEQVANLLSADIPLHPEERSKASRGYRLFRAIIPT